MNVVKLLDRQNVRNSSSRGEERMASRCALAESIPLELARNLDPVPKAKRS